MKINPSATADVLKTLIQEDRTEARIYRNRVQDVSYILAVASFALSAFLIGHTAADQLRYMTLLTDLGLVAITWISFWRIQFDLFRLRKALRARQKLLSGLHEQVTELDPFPNIEKDPPPDIKDTDLYWVVSLCTAVVLVKMLVLVHYAGSFVTQKGAS